MAGARADRPPIRTAVIVEVPREDAFSSFVGGIAGWWPTDTMSAGHEQVADVVVEPGVGGRVYERWHDGTEVPWGEVQRWEPPAAFTMSWTFTPAPTEVEMTFVELGPRLTRVAVEHRGWEALSDEQVAEDCAQPGGYANGAFQSGWEQLLARFTAHAHGAAAPVPRP